MILNALLTLALFASPAAPAVAPPVVTAAADSLGALIGPPSSRFT